jgi:hypothetical protein
VPGTCELIKGQGQSGKGYDPGRERFLLSCRHTKTNASSRPRQPPITGTATSPIACSSDSDIIVPDLRKRVADLAWCTRGRLCLLVRRSVKAYHPERERFLSYSHTKKIANSRPKQPASTKKARSPMACWIDIMFSE